VRLTCDDDRRDDLCPKPSNRNTHNWGDNPVQGLGFSERHAEDDDASDGERVTKIGEPEPLLRCEGFPASATYPLVPPKVTERATDQFTEHTSISRIRTASRKLRSWVAHPIRSPRKLIPICCGLR
jgi:hypothetical protein